MWPFKIERKPATPAEEKLEQIKNLLFPPLKLEEETSNDGSTVKFHVDYAVDSNIDAVLVDLMEGHNDEIAQKTLTDCVSRLNEARRLLDAYMELDPNAKYIIVENGRDSINVEAIE